ncbi:MAG: hypothetical protein HKP30_15480 [Myxococcales bacterium]|nr:hypothetical protein [Myxococcales bacterium]
MKSSFEESPWLRPRGAFVAADGSLEAPPPQEPDEESRQQAEALVALRETLRAELAEEQRAQLQSSCDALSEAAKGWRALDLRELESVRDGLVELGLAIARRVLESELRVDPEPLAALVGRALEELRELDGVRIALSPADLEHVESGAGVELRELAETWSAELSTDPTLARGEARVEAGAQHIDLRLDAILARFRESLREAVPAPDAEEDA